MRVSWPELLDVAARLVDQEKATVGVSPTLRRLHYLLVSDAEARGLGYANTTSAYKTLSDRTARAREAGDFPALVDRGRSVAHATGLSSLGSALRGLARGFSLDRSGRLAESVVVVAEKDGIVPLIRRHFGWLDVTATKGYASVPLADALSAWDHAVYVGDFDPTGVDIDRDLSIRADVTVHRVALTFDQVTEYGLPPAPAKAADSRRAAMVAEYGQAVQVEIDALPSTVLLGLIRDKIAELGEVRIGDDYWPVMSAVDAEEAEARRLLRELADRYAS